MHRDRLWLLPLLPASILTRPRRAPTTAFAAGSLASISCSDWPALHGGLLFVTTSRGARWSEALRDWAYHMAAQHYLLAVFLYVLMLPCWANCWASRSTTTAFAWSTTTTCPTRGRAPGYGTRPKAGWWSGAGSDRGEVIYFIIRRCAAALVDDRLGGFHRLFRADGAARAGGAFPDLLQVRAARESRP